MLISLALVPGERGSSLWTGAFSNFEKPRDCGWIAESCSKVAPSDFVWVLECKPRSYGLSNVGPSDFIQMPERKPRSYGWKSFKLQQCVSFRLDLDLRMHAKKLRVHSQKLQQSGFLFRRTDRCGPVRGFRWTVLTIKSHGLVCGRMLWEKSEYSRRIFNSNGTDREHVLFWRARQACIDLWAPYGRWWFGNIESERLIQLVSDRIQTVSSRSYEVLQV